MPQSPKRRSASTLFERTAAFGRVGLRSLLHLPWFLPAFPFFSSQIGGGSKNANNPRDLGVKPTPESSVAKLRRHPGRDSGWPMAFFGHLQSQLDYTLPEIRIHLSGLPCISPKFHPTGNCPASVSPRHPIDRGRHARTLGPIGLPSTGPRPRSWGRRICDGGGTLPRGSRAGTR